MNKAVVIVLWVSALGSGLLRASVESERRRGLSPTSSPRSRLALGQVAITMTKDPEFAQAVQNEPPSRRRRAVALIGLAALAAPLLVAQSLLLPSSLDVRTKQYGMHPSTHAQDRSVDWSFLHHSRQCPHLDPVGISEFTARRARLARTLSQGDAEWAAYVSEPRCGVRSRLSAPAPREG